jgi:pimeloyl-ACP methyl ester carboxylesterase
MTAFGAGLSRPAQVAVGLVLAVGLAGCSTLSRDRATTATGPTLAPLSATETVDVGGRQVATRCAGRAEDPSVLLVAGYDTELSEAWDDVQPAIGRFARVCAYDRLGVGGSDDPAGPQSFADMAATLDGVLHALRLSRPVVLVAHSLGGTVAATWAEKHREDLAGLVFIDATPPSFVATVLDTLPKETGRKGSELRTGYTTLLRANANDEQLSGRSAFDPPAVFSPVGSQPVVALSHSISEWGDVRRRDAARLDSAWLGGQQAWAELSTRGRVQIVDRAGHFIQDDQPQAVVDAVREVLSGS